LVVFSLFADAFRTYIPWHSFDISSILASPSILFQSLIAFALALFIVTFLFYMHFIACLPT